MAQLLWVMRSQQVKVIVRQPHEPAKNAEFLAGRIGAKVVVLAASVGATKQADD